MGRYVLRRLLQAIPTLIGIMAITFLLTRLSPSDPITLMLAGVPEVTEAQRAVIREAYGLNDPLPLQFARWAAGVLTLDFGDSFFYRRPVMDLILERLPNTLQLSLIGLAAAVCIGLPLGMIAALYRGRAADHGVRIVTVVFNAVPDFFLGLLVILFFAVNLKLLPGGSMNVVGEQCSFCLDRLWHLIGPVFLSANAGLAALPRFMRTEMLEVLGQDYIRTARSKGLREKVVVARHALRNALIPIVSVFGGVLAILVSGNVVIEVVFNWPGIGRLTFDAAVGKDYPIVQATVLLSSLLLVLSYILRDIAYAWVDPRIKVGS